jgi:hypothetical protein
MKSVQLAAKANVYEIIRNKKNPASIFYYGSFLMRSS